jgi:hypothetical protein
MDLRHANVYGLNKLSLNMPITIINQTFDYIFKLYLSNQHQIELLDSRSTELSQTQTFTQKLAAYDYIQHEKLIS